MSESVSLTSALSKKTPWQRFHLWIVGDTPIITHAWSQKAKQEMLQKQVKGVKSGKEAKNPQEDFRSSLYEMIDKDGELIGYGFPAMALKKAFVSSAHKDKGIAKTDIRASLWLDADMVSCRPALAGAVCDMPLVRIWGDGPVMREDMVRVGAGVRKTAAFAYRAQFTHWAVRLSGRFNPVTVTPEAIGFLVDESGMGTGIGDWRVEKDGMFGAYHMAILEEEAAWNAFAAGKGPLPIAQNYEREAA